ncbi:helix-turn-helix transcriptional regulator [Viridibacillus sp. YIM B01967]|uniref:Helix-turn-helix transcriptional regulator n=1 Tax=Viridibacillus soli TaxID=2798301 RepID=A0ABS1H936_9BACL|nr:helix-turn-helix transcriptional regulator [Viridibacillus soli]MBK3495528.1 helix-turn-helix transcriptional regulator [Viridibacillus soli]
MQNIGYIIKSERIRQNMKQKVLSKDICSTSYLSKIESEQKSPSQEVLDALIERLQINLNDFTSENEKQFVSKLYESYKSIVLTRNEQSAKEKLNYYMTKDFGFEDVTNFYFYNLYLFRLFLVSKQPLVDIEYFLKAFYAMEENLNDQQRFLYNLNANIYYCRKSDYLKALPFLESSINLLQKIQLEDWEKADYYYALALNYYSLNQNLNALEYAKMASDIYERSGYYACSVDCKILLAAAYSQNGHYSSAEKILLDASIFCNMYQLQQFEGLLSQNIGFIYALQGDAKKAISYYKKSYKTKTEPLSVLITIHSIIKEYSKLKQVDDVQKWCEKGLSLIRDNEPLDKTTAYLYHFEIFKMMHYLSPFDEKRIALAIDYFQQMNDTKNVQKYSILLGNLLFERNNYKKAAIYFQKSTEAMYQLNYINTWEDLT